MSWIEIANDSDFSLSNIPFGVFALAPEKIRPRCCTVVGETIVDLSILAEAGLFDGIPDFNARVFHEPTLNAFLEHPKSVWIGVRNRLIQLFSINCLDLQENKALCKASLHTTQDVALQLPVQIGDYTDFYSSREHATNVGTMFRGKDKALQPNWLHLPVGYHGRASTVVASGTPVTRPHGQLQRDPTDPSQGSILAPTQRLDFELEVAFYVGGPPNQQQPMSIEEASERIFGFCLMNDWSARDVQKWEYVPLGPFTSKNFCTTVSPWIVTTMALEEYVAATSAQQQTNPTPLEYLQDPNYSSYDIDLEVAIQSSRMDSPSTICRSNFRNLYWNATQQLVHHSVTGCTMKAGDLLGSGTISGTSETSFGSMLELSWNRTKEVSLGNGETRQFLQDGDTVVMRGHCQGKKEGVGRVGFGDCTGTILPAGQTTTTPPIATQDRYQDFKLYHYWESSASWRVRTALFLKKIPFQLIHVDLSEGEHNKPEHQQRVPMAQVPLLECVDTVTNKPFKISQSVAIVEFLEEAFPDRKALMPVDAADRAVAREMMEVINSGVQPLQNKGVLLDLRVKWNVPDPVPFAVSRIDKGLRALETMVAKRLETAACQDYCLGGFAPTVADIFLVPQLYNAKKFGIDTGAACPTLQRIADKCMENVAFQSSHASAFAPQKPSQT